MTLEMIRDYRSPNHDARAGDVDMLLIHYTGMASGAAALARLCDPHAKVSAHYLIEEDGRLFVLVPEDRRAWHAGEAMWAGARDINGLSIGIELVNPGHAGPGYFGGYRPFPEAQMATLISLARDILMRHAILPGRVLGHSDVAPRRKRDPGELFDWRRLAAMGVGLWPEPTAGPVAKANLPALEEGDIGPDVLALQRNFRAFGYGVELSERFDQDTRLVVEAFQRHFRPCQVDGVADGETQAVLRQLLG